jgi:hypothetical protein
MNEHTILKVLFYQQTNDLMETALEKTLTSFYKEGMISYMDAHPEDFEEAIKLAVSDKQPYSWRAAWLLWSCVVDNDLRVRAHIKNIINSITTKQDGHQRELLKILLKMELDEESEGFLFDVCATIWEKINKRPSVRFTAFLVILKIAKKYPDLYVEINALTQDQYLDTLSPGIKNSLSKMMKEFSQ